MAGIVDIANMALMRIAHSQTISDINEQSGAGNVLRVFYPQCRDQVLEESDWSFARKRVALALLPDTVTNWAFAYAYPADGVKIRGIVTPGARLLRKDQAVPYEIGFLGGVRVILTNMEQAEAVYTARVEDPNLFPPLFISALSDLIGSKAAMPLTGKRELVGDCLSTYSGWMARAQAANLNEGEAGPDPECEFIAVRQ